MVEKMTGVALSRFEEELVAAAVVSDLPLHRCLFSPDAFARMSSAAARLKEFPSGVARELCLERLIWK
jgi:hypothetical protein